MYKRQIINIRSSSKSAKTTIKHAQTFYIKEEIKSLYTKKSILNKQLLKLHLQMLNNIHPAIINNVLDSVHKYMTDVIHNIYIKPTRKLQNLKDKHS